MKYINKAISRTNMYPFQSSGTIHTGKETENAIMVMRDTKKLPKCRFLTNQIWVRQSHDWENDTLGRHGIAISTYFPAVDIDRMFVNIGETHQFCVFEISNLLSSCEFPENCWRWRLSDSRRSISLDFKIKAFFTSLKNKNLNKSNEFNTSPSSTSQ